MYNKNNDDNVTLRLYFIFKFEIPFTYIIYFYCYKLSII